MAGRRGRGTGRDHRGGFPGVPIRRCHGGVAAIGGVAIGAGPRGSRHGAVMAGVFDIDLETEEGSDGDEPELGAVSQQRGAGGAPGLPPAATAGAGGAAGTGGTGSGTDGGGGERHRGAVGTAGPGVSGVHGVGSVPGTAGRGLGGQRQGQ